MQARRLVSLVILGAFLAIAVLAVLGNPLASDGDETYSDLPITRTTVVPLVVVLGAVLAVWGVVHLRGLENIDHLVTTGPFSKLRHPMYVGFAMWIVGWAAYQGAVASLLLGPFGLASILWWRQLEELDLESRYGEACTAYRATTWV